MKKLLVYMPYGGKEYLDFLRKRFDVEQIHNIEKVRPDLVFFTGGADVNPELYGENKGIHTFINEKRDIEEAKLFSACARNKIKMLGICRGSQFLCVSAGGRLIQHVTGHAIGRTHAITDIGGRELQITSTHHQMMYPYDLPQRNYTVVAHSTNFLSNMYLNGENENLSVKKDFLEPEIVSFTSQRILAIQGHPEMSHCPKVTVEYCLDTIEKFLYLKNYSNKRIQKNLSNNSF